MTALGSVLAIGLLGAGVIESGTAEYIVEIAALIFIMLFVLMYPIVGYLMYSPRTVASHITVDTSGTTPALILRQSGSVFFASVVQIAFFTAIFVALTLNSYDPGDRISGWALVLVVTCGWQTGYFTCILIHRIRPGHIAIRHDGIHISDHATDTWIPWDAVVFPMLVTDPLYAVVPVHADSGAVATSRVPAPWRIIDDRTKEDVHPSPKRPRGRYVRVDRRRFRIAPELIDAALERYMSDPDTRRELIDPGTIARVVTELRNHAPTLRWRHSNRTVPVPRLEPNRW